MSALPTVQLFLVRDYAAARVTLGRLYVDGRRFGFVLEPPPARNGSAGPFCVPVTDPGAPYPIGVRFSPKHRRELLYVDVPGHDHRIELHPGNRVADTLGCLLPGTTRDVLAERVDHSAAACTWLEGLLLPGIKAGTLAATLAIVDGRPE